jgi:Vault protein inter-alpha-trypsin domain/FlgD Ig-like domain
MTMFLYHFRVVFSRLRGVQTLFCLLLSAVIMAGFAPTNASAQASLTIQDPRLFGRVARGMIDEATIAVTPKGTHMEIGLFLTFSSKTTAYTRPSDTLEVVYNFTLPQGAIVTDSWLWVGNDVVQAGIYDTWTATRIYEGIVRRRQDPSLLRKRAGNAYELRIFPLQGNESRKVKINYLVPVAWTTSQASVPLPTDLLAASSLATPFTVLFRGNPEWARPQMAELKDVAFTTAIDQSNRSEYQTVRVDPALLGTKRALTLVVPAPMSNGLYASTFKSGTEGYYQTVVVPSIALGIDTLIKRKILAVVDYDGALQYNSLSFTDVFSNLKNTLLTTLTPRDSFNLVLSRLTPWRYSNQWIPGDSLSIERAFSSMNTAQLSSFSNLPATLINSIEFIKSRGGEGSILLVSNSEQMSSKSSSDQFIQELSDLTQRIPPMYSVNYNGSYYYTGRYFYWNNTYYYGNSYLYEVLAKNTGGMSSRPSNTTDLANQISSYVQAIDATITGLDYSVTLANGYCYSRFSNLDANAQNTTFAARQSLIQVGKYQGDVPMRVQIGGTYKDKVYVRSFELPASSVFRGDSVHKANWAGYALRAQEGLSQTATTIRAILDLSIPNRVLSNYTAFLALEPNDTVRPCLTCTQPSSSGSTPNGNGSALGGNPSLVSVQSTAEIEALTLTASPNPFRDDVQIAVEIPATLSNSALTLEVSNILGQRVKTFAVAGGGKGKQMFTWDGKDANGNDIAAGTYFLTIVSPQKRVTVRLVKM